MTGALLRRGGQVIAVERDRDMAAVLRNEFRGVENFELVEGDATAFDITRAVETRGVHGVRVVGNLPYAITGAILRNLVQHARSIDSAVLMVQKEVRDRLVASAGTRDYGGLTVFMTAAFEVRSAFIVAPGSFHPAPKVKSAVLELTRRAVPLAEETTAFRAVVKAAFETRRKTLRNALSRLDGMDKAQASAVLEAAGIDGDWRGERCSVSEFRTLSEAYERLRR